MMKTTVRKVLEKDTEAIFGIHRQAIAALEGGPYEKHILDAWERSVTLTAIRNSMGTSDVKGFLAERGGLRIGFAALQRNILIALYVDPAWQGMGIGSTLLTRIETEAARQRVDVLNLMAPLNAVNFYECRGYRIVEEVLFHLNAELKMKTFDMTKYII